MNFGVIVHGGAWDIPDEAVASHLEGVESAINASYEVLKSGNKAIDAVEIAIAIMEDDPTFDAGKGSFLNISGEVEMDAMIATDEYRIGSVCAIRNVKNPIKIARILLESEIAILLAGEGASQFAGEFGHGFYPTEALLVGRELERFNELRFRKDFSPKSSFKSSKIKQNGMGTVGAVCIDQNGTIAIGVSTGGTPFKRVGRVGDSPLWGCGGYVEKIGGAAATGYGEDLIRILAARRAIDFLRSGFSAHKAAEKTIQELNDKVSGYGGMIVLSPDEIGLAFNTPRMAFAYKTEGEKMYKGIEYDDQFELQK